MCGESSKLMAKGWCGTWRWGESEIEQLQWGGWWYESRSLFGRPVDGCHKEWRVTCNEDYIGLTVSVLKGVCPSVRLSRLFLTLQSVWRTLSMTHQSQHVMQPAYTFVRVLRGRTYLFSMHSSWICMHMLFTSPYWWPDYILEVKGQSHSSPKYVVAKAATSTLGHESPSSS